MEMNVDYLRGREDEATELYQKRQNQAMEAQKTLADTEAKIINEIIVIQKEALETQVRIADEFADLNGKITDFLMYVTDRGIA